MRRIKKKIFVALLILTQIIGVYQLDTVEAAVITKIYDGMVKLHPIGWSAGYVLFKGGKPVTFNDRNEVISGTLEGFAGLRPAGIAMFHGTDNGYVAFKGGTEVVFDENGTVIIGTLAENTEFLLTSGKEGVVKYKGNTVVTFKNGGSSGTLTENSYFRPVGFINGYLNSDQSGYFLFKANTYIAFNEKGEVLEGTLVDDVWLHSVGGNIKNYAAGSLVHFSNNGEVY